jgi:hypothetical protein
MNKLSRSIYLTELIIASALLWSVSSPAFAALPSAFTYDGVLSIDNGRYDLRFKLWTDPTDGTQVGSTLIRQQVTLQALRYRVNLDFGTGAFTGDNRYLEIGYRPAISTGAFTVLSSRILIRPVPYAIHAETAANADNATSAANSINADRLGGWDASNYWKSYSGTQINQTTPLAAGGQDYWFTFGYPVNQLVVWRVLPTTDQAKLRVEVEAQYVASNNSVTYYLRVFNTGSVASTYQVIRHISFQ